MTKWPHLGFRVLHAASLTAAVLITYIDYRYIIILTLELV